MPPKKRRQYGTGSVTKRPDGQWVGRFYAGWTPDGKRRRISVYGRTEAEAKAKLKERQRAFASGEVTGLDVRTTVQAWSKVWLPQHAKKVRPTTYTTDAGAIAKWVIPTIGHRRLADLTPGDLRRVEDAIRNPDQKGGARSSTTALHTHKILLAMLKAARVEGHHVPARLDDAPRPVKAANDRGEIPLTDALAILKVVATRDDGARWLSALLNVLRQGESLGLTWDCVDLERARLDVSWQLQVLPYRVKGDPSSGFRVPDDFEARRLTGSFHLTRPKTASGQRLIPLVPWMRDALALHRSVAPDNPWGLVWTSPTGQPIRAEDDRKRWYDITDAAGVRHPSGRRYHLHETRHTAISLLMRHGVDRSVVEALAGHSQLVATYVHVDDTQTRDAMARLAAALSPRAIES